jgi:hypothetical protein
VSQPLAFAGELRPRRLNQSELGSVVLFGAQQQALRQVACPRVTAAPAVDRATAPTSVGAMLRRMLPSPPPPLPQPVPSRSDQRGHLPGHFRHQFNNKNRRAIGESQPT